MHGYICSEHFRTLIAPNHVTKKGAIMHSYGGKQRTFHAEIRYYNNKNVITNFITLAQCILERERGTFALRK